VSGEGLAARMFPNGIGSVHITNTRQWARRITIQLDLRHSNHV